MKDVKNNKLIKESDKEIPAMRRSVTTAHNKIRDVIKDIAKIVWSIKPEEENQYYYHHLNQFINEFNGVKVNKTRYNMAHITVKRVFYGTYTSSDSQSQYTKIIGGFKEAGKTLQEFYDLLDERKISGCLEYLQNETKIYSKENAEKAQKEYDKGGLNQTYINYYFEHKSQVDLSSIDPDRYGKEILLIAQYNDEESKYNIFGTTIRDSYAEQALINSCRSFYDQFQQVKKRLTT